MTQQQPPIEMRFKKKKKEGKEKTTTETAAIIKLEVQVKSVFGSNKYL